MPYTRPTAPIVAAARKRLRMPKDKGYTCDRQNETYDRQTAEMETEK